MTIRYHLDEHIHPGIAAGLRAQGVDVVTTVDAGLLGADDAAHIAFAFNEYRVVVTCDNDFLRHCAQGMEHAGIVYCHRNKYSVGEHLNLLLLLHACCTAEEMHGQVEYL